MLLNTFEMCCMGKPVFYVLFYVILRVFFQGVINQFENEEGSDDPRDSVLLGLFFLNFKIFLSQ
jgi:hypothetical protein